MMKREKKTQGHDLERAPSHSRRPIPEWMAVKLDFPPEVLTGGMRVELQGRNVLLVHGCRRILHYTPDILRFLMKGCVLCVEGKRLICHTYLAGAVGVEGQIDRICFEDEEIEPIC